MKRTEPVEPSAYEAALNRVRELRTDPATTTGSSRPGLIQHFRRRMHQVRLGLHLPAFAPPGPKRKQRISTRLDFFLWICLPLVPFLVFMGAQTDFSPSSDAVMSIPSRTSAIQTFDYPVSSPSLPLADSEAITKATECMARSGYDLHQWTSEDIHPVTGISSTPQTMFQRVDEKSGYIVFVNPRKPSHRVTVTLMQSDYSLKVIVSDSSVP